MDPMGIENGPFVDDLPKTGWISSQATQDSIRNWGAECSFISSSALLPSGYD